MSVPIENLAEDRWYITAQRELRRIVKIENGKVSYKVASRSSGEIPWSDVTTVPLEKFAREVIREVRRPHYRLPRS
jgi:hypothetical protein